MAETLLEKANRLGMKPAGDPVAKSESLVEKAQRLGMEPANRPQKEPGTLQRIIQGVAKLPLSVVSSAVNLTNTLPRSNKDYERVRDEGVDYGYFGKVQPVGAVKGGIESVGDFGKGVAKSVGSGIEAASYLVGGGEGANLVKTGLKEGLKQTVKRGAIEGTALGSAGGLGSGLQDEDSTTGSVIKSTALGGALGGVLGGATGGISGAIGNLKLPKVPSKTAADVDRLVGTIIQGKTQDIPLARKALSNIDASNVRTYGDVYKALDDKIKAVSERFDDVLDTNKGVTKLKDFSQETKAGSKKIKTNYVEDAIDQLSQFYKKTNDVPGQADILRLKAKAKSTGLTVKEVNDLAKLHGKDLNGYNANGELASGLTKQNAENTRKGIKSSAKNIFKNDIYDAVDSELSSLINTRSLAKDMVEAVNKLSQKAEKRGFGQKLGGLISRVVDLSSGGTLKGAANYFIPKGEGLKVMNALDLESKLAKNLRVLKEVTSQDLPEETIIKKLERMISGELPVIEAGGKPKKLPKKLSPKPKTVPSIEY